MLLFVSFVSLYVQSMSDSEDSDFLGVASFAASASNADIAAVSDSSSEEDFLEVQPTAREVVATDTAHGALVPANDSHASKRRLSFTAGRAALKGTLRQARTPAQHALITEHMRHVRTNNELANLKFKFAKHVASLAEKMQHQVLRCGALVVSQKSQHGFSTLCIRMPSEAGAGQLRLSSQAWMRIAFEEMHTSTHAVARRYQVSARTVKRLRIIMAGFVKVLLRTSPTGYVTSKKHLLSHTTCLLMRSGLFHLTRLGGCYV